MVIFPHQREALEPGRSLRVQWVLAFLTESDGELHKGNSITRLTLSLWGKLLPVVLFFFNFSFLCLSLRKLVLGPASLRQDTELDGSFFWSRISTPLLLLAMERLSLSVLGQLPPLFIVMLLGS